MAAPAKRRAFWPWLAALVILCGLNIFILLIVVPKFEQIYTDALPGMPLPDVTIFIIAYRLGLACMALGWPIIGLILRQRQKGYEFLWTNLGVVWFLLELGTTIFALFKPMTVHYPI